MPIDPARLEEYQRWLTGKPSALPVSGKDERALLLKGVLVTLAQAASTDNTGQADNAVFALCQAVIEATDAEVSSMALAVLDHLARVGSQPARDGLIALVIHHDHPGANELVVTNQYTHSGADDTSLLFLLTGQMARLNQLDPDRQLLTTAYHAAHEALRKKAIRVARAAGLEDWAETVTAVQSATPESLTRLTGAIPHFKTDQAKTFAIELLRDLADKGNPDAREAICRLFIETGDSLARQIAVKEGYAPEESVARALFLLLSGQQEKYETLDFNRSLLTVGYETANKALRQRIIAQTRRLGHLEWAQALTGSRRTRWVSDMTDADWEIAVTVLRQGEKWDDLWQLAQIAPPVWSIRALFALRDSGWIERQDEAGEILPLVELAQRCASQPPGVPLRLTLTGHLSEVTCLAVNPGGDLIASGAMDQTIIVWNARDGRLRRRLLMPRGQVRSLAFSPDSEIVAAGNGDGSMQLFRLGDSELIKIYLGHTGVVKSMAVSPEGWIIASGSFDQSVRLWRFPFGPELKTLMGHTSEVFAVEIAPNGRMLITASADKSVRLWSLPDGTPLKKLEGHTDTVTALAVSPDGLIMATGGRDRLINLWNLPDGYPRHRLDPQDSIITSLAIHPDGQVLASAGFDGTITLWSVSNGKPLLSFKAHDKAVTGLVVADGGNSLASSSVDRTIKLFDLRMLLMTRLPVEQVRVRAGDLSRMTEGKGITESDRRWLDFAAALLRWKGRYDIALEEPRRIEVGEFDIEIVPLEK